MHRRALLWSVYWPLFLCTFMKIREKKKKLLSVLLSTAMVVTMLMGCGDSGSTGNADNTQTEEPAKEEAAASAADEEKETAGDT